MSTVNIKEVSVEDLYQIKKDLFTIRAYYHERRKVRGVNSSIFLCCLLAELTKSSTIEEVSQKYLAYEIDKELGGSNFQTMNTLAYRKSKDTNKRSESTEVFIARGNKYRLTFLNRLIRRVRTEIAKREKV